MINKLMNKTVSVKVEALTIKSKLSLISSKRDKTGNYQRLLRL